MADHTACTGCGGSCSGCTGGCGGCGGCATIYLEECELSLIRILSVCAYLPVARTAGKEYLCLEPEAEAIREEIHQAIRGLIKKGLLSADLTHPLRGFSYAAYPDSCTEYGSIGFTARGYSLLEQLEFSGIQ